MEQSLLNWSLVFLILCLISAVLGFGHAFGEASWAGQVCCAIFLCLFVSTSVASGHADD